MIPAPGRRAAAAAAMSLVAIAVSTSFLETRRGVAAPGLGTRRPSAGGSGPDTDRSSDGPYRSDVRPPAPAGDGGAPTALPPLPALPPEPLFTNLDVPGHPQAVVSLPNGASSRRPVAVVLHGVGDRPDWNCDAWRHITDAQGFILCLRGRPEPRESTPGDARFTLEGGAALREHLDAAVTALVARFGPYVDPALPMLAGFSLGATLAGQIALAEPGRFVRLALLEGGHGMWTAVHARQLATGGGPRVLFGCGSTWCRPAAAAAKARLDRAGVEARDVYANVGHTNDRPLQEAIMREHAWFFEGDARWEVTTLSAIPPR